MSTPKFYPPLTTLMSLDDIPPAFDFVKQAANALFSDIYFRNFQFQKSARGDKNFFKLILILNDTLSFAIGQINNEPAVEVVFFPDAGTGTTTEIPVELDFSWELFRIISKITQFDPQTFDFNPQTTFDLILDILGIEPENLVRALINAFTDDPDFESSLNTLISSINTYYSGTGTPVNQQTGITDESSAIDQVIGEVEALAQAGVFQALFDVFINNTDKDIALGNIDQLFLDLFGVPPVQYIERLLIPKIRAVLHVGDPNSGTAGLGIFFHRNILTPLDANGDPLPLPERSALNFSFGSLIADTESGIYFKEDILATLNHEAAIANTDFKITLTNVRVDFSETRNIPEADAYGKPLSFRGVYIEEITVKLPPQIFSDTGGQTLGITGRKMLIGDGGFTGTVGLLSYGGTLEAKLPGNMLIGFDHFYLEFVDNIITGSSLKGSLTFNADSNPHTIVLEGYYENSGFGITATGGPPNNNIFAIPLGDFGTLELLMLTIGSENQAFFFSIGMRMEYQSSFKLLDRFLPNPIELRELKISERGIEKFDINIQWNDLDDMLLGSLLGDDPIIIPLNLNLFDVLIIKQLKIKLGLTDDNKFRAQTLVDGTLEIGPVLASVGDVGVEVLVAYDKTGNGNFGPLDMAIQFVPPSKIAMRIDAEAVTGGGAIWFDYDNERYVGALELSIKDTLSLVVIGIMSFKKPDGSKGFSLLLLVTVEFTPVQLGMGFVLVGVGGLLGINRGMNADALRDGVRTGMLDYILFPTNPIENIDAIVQGLETAYPQRQDQFIIGPMLKLGWGGARSLVQLEIGLMIEIPNPVKIAIPGILSILLPTDEEDVVSINVNFIGIIDFQEKFASFDASLFDSGILDKITLTGDMAFRLKWGDEPDFLISIGGFHPQYTPPPLKLPKMARLGINLLNIENARVGFELYFAVTTNSVQFGAAVFAEFTAGKFAVVGGFSFDALFEFNPFRMILSAELKAALEYDGFPIVAIVAMIQLSGPTPWNISGTASIAIIGIEFKIDFDHTFGEVIDTSIPSIELMPLVRTELEKPNNWRSAYPSGSKSMVQLRAVEEGTEKVAAHPSGTFLVEQGIIPLNIPMTKYGQNGIADFNEFNISRISAVSPNASEDLDFSPIRNLFAPDQHFTLTNEEKLSSPAFERFTSGAVIDKTDKLYVSTAQVKHVAYEQILVQPEVHNPKQTQESTATTVTDDKNTFENLTGGGAIGQSPFSAKNKAPSEEITWQKENNYYIVNAITMQPLVSLANLPEVRSLSKSEAQRLLDKIIEDRPQLEDLLIILEAHELDPSLLANPANEAAVLAM